MSCCGSKRAELSGSQMGGSATRSQQPVATQRMMGGTVVFKYIGQTNLVVVGPATGQRYAFNAPGSRVAVFWADQPWLAALSVLHQEGGAEPI
jgi:hypothetical protein